MDPYFLLNIEWRDTHLFGQVSESVVEPFYCLEHFPQYAENNGFISTYAITLDLVEYGGMIMFKSMAINVEHPIGVLSEWAGKIPFDLLNNAERSHLENSLEGIKQQPTTIRDRLQAILALD